jgi:hypothetical protein
MSVFVWFIIILLVLIAAGWLYLRWKMSILKKANEAEKVAREERLRDLPTIPLANRDDDAIYQWSNFHGERLVARVVGPEVNEEAKEVTFVEIINSDYLLLPDECHYQKYRLEIDTVRDAIKKDRTDPEKGRILREVHAKIIGYVEH